MKPDDIAKLRQRAQLYARGKLIALSGAPIPEVDIERLLVDMWCVGYACAVEDSTRPRGRK